ncbi:MAG: class II aldolase/adducin family protein [Planctomycetota bacterium]|nr:class II aldolase/adducin family protein [Planctomycetota bacterium]
MLTAIGDVMRQLYSRGWITSRDGNVSVRFKDGDRLHITPSGWRKTIIHPEHLVEVPIVNGQMDLSGSLEPSGELHMHWLLQRNARDTRAVVHAHPTHIVAAMYRGFDLPTICDHFPEIYRYTRVGDSVPTLPAVSDELGEATAFAHRMEPDGSYYFDVVGQASHGVCAIGNSPWDAYEHIERLNHICEIVLASGIRPDDAHEKAIG